MTARDSDGLPRRIGDLDGRDAYDLLGLTPDAAPEDIAAAYRREMLRAHPDRGGSEQRAQLVNCAHEVLTRHRDEYDELLGGDPLAAGADVICVEPDGEPLDDPVDGGPRRRRRGYGLLALGTVVVLGIAAVALDRPDEEPSPPAAAWTTSEVGAPSAPSAPLTSPPPPPSRVSPAVAPTAVVAAASAPAPGGGHRCEVRGDGSLWCAGANDHGQLGIGSTADADRPTRVGVDGVRWVVVSVGGQASCGLRADGTLWCWGDNSHGQLGDGTNSARDAPVPVDPPGRWLALDVDTHVCAVRDDHTLWCWGAGQRGELGAGGRGDRASPVRLGAETGWAAVTVGPGWTCGIRQDGSRQCWGADVVPTYP